MSTEAVPVLIVGGGSVGLAAAVFLAHRGVPAVLVERRPGLSIHPRAVGLGVRSVELFRGVGLERAVRDAAAPLANNSGWISVETLASPDLPAALARRPRPAATADALARFSPTTGLHCSQDALDPVLHDDALRHGARIEYGTELVALDQDAGGVTARLVRLDGGGELAVRADYLIAADGAGSVVRRALSIPTGGPAGRGPHLINALFEADLSALLGDQPFQLCEVKNPGFTGMFIAIRGARRFVLHFGYDPDRGERPEDFTPDRCRAMIRAAIGLPDVPVAVLSIRPWQVAARLAGRFRDGRCFLAGDAAHVVPPTGGFGMNTGFADAHNLAWKLALALAGKAGPGLLDSYDAERRPVAGFTMDQAILRLLHPHLHFDPSRAAEQGQAGIAASAVVHLGLGYTAGAVVEPRTALPSLSDLALDLDGAPGTRLPHWWVERGGERISSLDLVGPGFLLLAGPAGGAWCAAAAESAARLGVELSAYRVGPSADVQGPDGGVRSALGLGDSGALLVRPDGFVGWRSPTPDAEPGRAVRRALRQVLGHTEGDG